MTRVGVISDTHGLLREEAVNALAGCQLIIHAGDVGDPAILRTLASIAPLRAVRGNVDDGEWAEELPLRLDETVEEVRFHVHHGHLPPSPWSLREARVIVTGHSHRPVIEWRGEVLHLNPGSAGPRRFSLPVCLAIAKVAGEEVSAELVELLI